MIFMVKGQVLNVKWGHLLVAIRRVLDEQVLRDAAARYFIKIYARHNPQEQSAQSIHASKPTTKPTNEPTVMATLSTSSLLWIHSPKPISPKLALFTATRFFTPKKSTSIVMAAPPTTTATEVVPAIIVGGGRVGKALQDMGKGDDLLVKRGEAVPLDFEGPILVCTRNDDLEAVLEATPKSRWNADLVFFQNGMLEPWLQSKGLNDAEQVLAYFAVAKLGEPPIDGKTDTNPEGLTAAYGKWASAIATRLNAGGLSCKEGKYATPIDTRKGLKFSDIHIDRGMVKEEVLDKEAFQKQMLEKLIWICAFMLVGARHPGATVGVVEKEYRSEVSSLIAELASAAAAEKGITFEEAMEDRLCAYSRAVAHFPTAVKEFKWRNGWFYSISEKAIAEGKPDPCPLHTAWLKELNVV
ncbi:hypothetical protein Gohar_023250 [Gossypium harknessii]|uniref:Uncharacterized protein n=1 Tax=Gossypium harknessii TaxID=34285 RepID=A0A7J9HET4_9ROSI|nr:hypothetical protein [Gossypium harknessii]